MTLQQNKEEMKQPNSTKRDAENTRVGSNSNNWVMAISGVQTKGDVHYIIDSSGNKTATLPASLGEVMGIGTDFIVVQKSCWYYTYDEKGQKIATLVSSAGEFKNAVGNSFNLKKGCWLYTFNKHCKKIGTRVA